MNDLEGEIVKTTFNVPKRLLKKLQHYAIDHDMTDKDVIIAAIAEYLETAHPNKETGA